MTKNEVKWEANYDALYEYISMHGHLPDKKKVVDRRLLNWWKYNKRLLKQGKHPPERAERLVRLGEMRIL